MHWHTPLKKKKNLPQGLVRATDPCLSGCHAIGGQRHLRCRIRPSPSWNGAILTSAKTRSRGPVPPGNLACAQRTQKGCPTCHQVHLVHKRTRSRPTLPMLCWPQMCFLQRRATQEAPKGKIRPLPSKSGAPKNTRRREACTCTPVLDLPTGALLRRPKNETSAV